MLLKLLIRRRAIGRALAFFCKNSSLQAQRHSKSCPNTWKTIDHIQPDVSGLITSSSQLSSYTSFFVQNERGTGTFSSCACDECSRISSRPGISIMPDTSRGICWKCAVYLLQRRQISYRVHSYAGTDKAAEMQSRATSSANRPPSRSVRVDLRE